MEKIKLGISTCLLGENVRYDGGHKLDRFLTDTLGQYVEYVPVCPEVECGLPVPRESMHLEGDPRFSSLSDFTDETGYDGTHGSLGSRDVLLKLRKRIFVDLFLKAILPAAAWNGSRSIMKKGCRSKRGLACLRGYSWNIFLSFL